MLSIVMLIIGAVSLSMQGVFAANSVTVTPSDSQGWVVTNEDLGASVEIVDGPPAILGSASLKLSTGTDFDSKAQYSKLGMSVPLSSVTEMSYWTYQNDVNRVGNEIPSYQLRLDMDGTGSYVADFQYYASQNQWVDPDLQDIAINKWQKWDVLSSAEWATFQPIPGTYDPIPELTPGEGGIESGIAGAARGGGEFYTIAEILQKYPNAQVVGIGVSLGVWYENSTSYADGVSINNTVYDFEVALPAPQTKDDCKKDGWRAYNFKNQGQCVSSVVKNQS